MALTGKYGEDCDPLLSRADTPAGAAELYRCLGVELSKQGLTRFERQFLRDKRKNLYDTFGPSVRNGESTEGSETRNYITVDRPKDGKGHSTPGVIVILYLSNRIYGKVFVPAIEIEDETELLKFVTHDLRTPWYLQPVTPPGRFRYPLHAKLLADILNRIVARVRSGAGFNTVGVLDVKQQPEPQDKALAGLYGGCDNSDLREGSLSDAIKLYSCLGNVLANAKMTRFERQTVVEERERLYREYGSSIRLDDPELKKARGENRAAFAAKQQTYKGKIKRTKSNYITTLKPVSDSVMLILVGANDEINRRIVISEPDSNPVELLLKTIEYLGTQKILDLNPRISPELLRDTKKTDSLGGSHRVRAPRRREPKWDRKAELRKLKKEFDKI